MTDIQLKDGNWSPCNVQLTSCISVLQGKLKTLQQEFDDYRTIEDHREIDVNNAIYAKLAKLSDRVDDLEGKVEKPAAEPHDIAKERWEFIGEGTIARIGDCDGLVYREDGIATDEQMNFMAAAPEVADKARVLLNELEHVVAYHEDCEELIHLLRKLGMKDVAPWYKE